MLELTNENYFSTEADIDYCSKSQYQKFFGTGVVKGCEVRALAELRGEYEQPKGKALLLGSLVDNMLLTPEEVEKFKAENPQLFSSRGATKGQIKADFSIADVMVERAKRDKLFMKTLEGDHQTIMTGEIFGVPFKVKMDVYREGKYITDLKTTSDYTKQYYDLNLRRYVNFMEAWNYQLQGAIYREIVFQNTGKRLPFYISAITSQDHPRIQVFNIDHDSMDEALAAAEDNIRSLQLLKNGEIEPTPCMECDYCADNIPLSGISDWLSRETE